MGLFPKNTRSRFESFININDLDYLPEYNIEAAIKSITFDNRRDAHQLKDEILAVRSNVTKPTIRNGSFDRIISIFNASSKSKDVTHIDFKNPTFFETSKESLAAATFEIINIDSDSPPDFAFGSPTFIQLAVKKSASGMKKPFNVFLDSSDKISNALYPTNNSIEFTVKLPDILEFKRDWHVTLKSLHIPNLLYNINKSTCSWQYDEGPMPGEWWFHQGDYIQEGCYPTAETLVNKLQSDWDAKHVPLVISLKNGKVKILYKKDNQEDEKRIIQLYLNPKLKNILGFNISEDSGQALRFDHDSQYTASYDVNLFLLTPKNIIVSCNIVEETNFGGQSLKLLRLVTNNLDHSSNMLHFEFYSNEYVELKTKSFENITIRLSDVSGKLLKSASTAPTRLQLTFINT